MSKQYAMRKDGKGEPASPGDRISAPFRIGKDSHGHWVVQDASGMHGGLFVDRVQALKYAMFENGHRPQAVIMVPGILELEIGAKPCVNERPLENRQVKSKRSA
jgi:hypothetical protein